jgi:septal ring factor EnvC (AmiA/AmiB activator)
MVLASSAGASNRSTQKKQAEDARAELQDKLKSLKNEINKTVTAKDRASEDLEEVEDAISNADRSLHELQDEQALTEQKLKELLEAQAQLNIKINRQKQQLADFLRHQYMHGDSDRIKLLLSGDNPNRINRELQYMGYVSQTEAKMIAGLRGNLATAEKTTQEAQAAKAELDEIAEEEQTHKLALEKDKKKRANLLTQLSNKLYKQKKEADSLQKDEQRLSNLVLRLNKLIEEQIKAEQLRAAQLEKQHQEKLAADKLKKEKQQANQVTKSGKINRPNPIDDDEPPKKVSGNANAVNDGSEFSRLKGQLHLPVKGDLIARFGSKRDDGPSWKGLFIKALEGTEVKAIAAGKVVFAEWLRGFGNMIILDHGGQYLSLYSNNQSVLKHAGDTVKAGETIAAAGNSGGNEESGLYFELRYQGRVFDPLSWISK